MAKPAVSLEIRRQSGANSVAVIEGSVKQEIEALRGIVPGGREHRDHPRPVAYIYAALHEIEIHLVLGSILASLVVLAFMRSWRSTLIAGVAIPASVVSTFGVMWAFDFTLNSVTMLALVLMVGIVIDDAIVVLENIYKLVEEQRHAAHGGRGAGHGEIALAVLATTLSLVVIFVPVSFMSSISGRFLYQFGVTAAVAVLVSLLVSFTLTPMMASRMLRPVAVGHGTHAVPQVAGFYAWLDRALHTGAAVVRAAPSRHTGRRGDRGVVAVPLYGLLRQDYVPSDVDEAEFNVNVQRPRGREFRGIR
jgi:HAE1 family hydrophobic/amphiphilic exporter-1